MKYLDTYETWSKIFKLVRADDDLFKIFIHDNCWLSTTMDIVSLSEKELVGLAEFIQDFLGSKNEK